MNILVSGNQIAIIFIVIGIVAVLVALGVLLYIFVFSRNAVKKQIRELERKYSYFDALLVGQDTQYIHH